MNIYGPRMFCYSAREPLSGKEGSRSYKRGLKNCISGGNRPSDKCSARMRTDSGRKLSAKAGLNFEPEPADES